MRLLTLVSAVALAALSACYSPGNLCSDYIDGVIPADPEITKITCTNDSNCKYAGAENSQEPCYYCNKPGAGAGKCAVVPGPFRCNLNGEVGIDDVCPDGFTCATVPGSGDWCVRNDLLAQ